MPTSQHPDRSGPVVPDGMPVLDAGAHRDARSGSCVMEYVSVLAGERFTDRPTCTHPAVAAIAWQANDALSHDARQRLAHRAPDLVGAGRGHDGPVRPVVLGVLARSGLRLDPGNRFFLRLLRRLDVARVDTELRRAQGRPTTDGVGGRIATLLHVGPVNHACAHLLVAARTAGLDAPARDALMLALLDDCLAAVHASAPERAEPVAVG